MPHRRMPQKVGHIAQKRLPTPGFVLKTAICLPSTPAPRYIIQMTRLCIYLLAGLLPAQTVDWKSALETPLLDPDQALLEAQVYTASRVPLFPTPATVNEWDRYASALRGRVLEEVVFRGTAKRWKTPERKVEWLDTIDGGGYRIKKFRFEALPGMWIPALLYEPAAMSGKLPVVMNVNGHEKTGISTPYIQERCINLARRGMLAVNAEWQGRGQMDVSGFNHTQMPQIDLTGTSGLAVFYLAMERTLDIILAHPNSDAKRVAVTGLSGGGWQTTIISSLDERVRLAVPVAGHSSFVTRAQWPALDLGDGEQTPSDLASIADYSHLTAMIAPRPLMLINNAKDSCCFRADYAMGPLLQSSRSVFSMYGAAEKLRYFINHSKGHNYDQSSREELYRFLAAQFDLKTPSKEFPAASEVRSEQQLAIAIPANNATFHSLALDLAKSLPNAGEATRERLASIVRTPDLKMDAREIQRKSEGGVETIWWQLRMGGSWTVPAVEAGPAGAKETVILVSDEGRRTMASQVSALIGEGKRVIAIDPFLFGESKIARRDWLFAILIASLGERPLGLMSGQILSVARWLESRGMQVSVQSEGRRTGLAALVASALDPKLITRTKTRGALRSLKQILEEDLTVDKYPEFFCFGLLQSFDVDGIAKLAAKVETF